MKTKSMIKLEENIGENLVSYLHREYYKQFGRLEVISKRLGIPRSTLTLYMKRIGLKPRKSSETLIGGKEIPTKEELQDMYIKCRNSLEKIEISNSSWRYSFRSRLAYISSNCW